MSELLENLQKLYPDSSKRTLKNWIKWGRVEGQGEEIQIKKKTDDILYADKELIVIEKPGRLLSVPDEKGSPSALDLLKSRYKTLFPVHRLDRDASGVLVFARTIDMKRKLGQLFHDHDLEREYIAAVEGKLEGKGSFRYPLLELDNYRVIVSSDGRDAITHFETLATNGIRTLLKLRLETGRKHQIRVHLQKAGHPIVGDARYGSTQNPFKRLALHATKLSFVHPGTKKFMTFTSSYIPRFTNINLYN